MKKAICNKIQVLNTGVEFRIEQHREGLNIKVIALDFDEAVNLVRDLQKTIRLQKIRDIKHFGYVWSSKNVRENIRQEHIKRLEVLQNNQGYQNTY